MTATNQKELEMIAWFESVGKNPRAVDQLAESLLNQYDDNQKRPYRCKEVNKNVDYSNTRYGKNRSN